MRVSAFAGLLLLAVVAAFGAPLSSQTTLTFNGTGAGAIPDGPGGGPANYGAPLNMLFNVSGFSGNIQNVEVTFTGNHTWVGDLEVMLFAPGGTGGLLFELLESNIGQEGSDSELNGTYTFKDTAANNIWAAAAAAAGGVIPSGNYRVVQSGMLVQSAVVMNLTAYFSSLMTINGLWSLRFRDGWNTDTGSITAASLTITTSGGMPPPTGAPTITSAQPGFGSIGVAYSHQYVATGTPATFTWTLTSGALPTGLTLNPNTGLVSGTPTVQANFIGAVTVSNGVLPDDTQAFNIDITGPVGPTITSGSPPQATINVAYSFTFTATANPANCSWAVSAGSLPPGLNLNGSTGAVQGTPTVLGDFNVTVTCSNGVPPNASTAVTFRVREASAGGNLNLTGRGGGGGGGCTAGLSGGVAWLLFTGITLVQRRRRGTR